jgi:hypothetical protein
MKQNNRIARGISVGVHGFTPAANCNHPVWMKKSNRIARGISVGVHGFTPAAKCNHPIRMKKRSNQTIN